MGTPGPRFAGGTTPDAPGTAGRSTDPSRNGRNGRSHVEVTRESRKALHELMDRLPEGEIETPRAEVVPEGALT